jgi:formate hydrogenlyase subunit 4
VDKEPVPEEVLALVGAVVVFVVFVLVCATVALLTFEVAVNVSVATLVSEIDTV